MTDRQTDRQTEIQEIGRFYLNLDVTLENCLRGKSTQKS